MPSPGRDLRASDIIARRDRFFESNLCKAALRLSCKFVSVLYNGVEKGVCWI